VRACSDIAPTTHRSLSGTPTVKRISLTMRTDLRHSDAYAATSDERFEAGAAPSAPTTMPPPAFCARLTRALNLPFHLSALASLNMTRKSSGPA